MVIKILGSGCNKCNKLEQNARKAAGEAGIEYSLEKVTDINRIMEYGVALTPALVIDDKVVSSGKVLSPEKILTLLKRG